MNARSVAGSTRRTATAVRGRCKDCEPGSKRVANYPGPRCWTHHKARRRKLSAARKASRLEKTYSITEEQYQALYAAQGGVCAICKRVKGTGKYRLAVDHDHACCDGPVSCGKCVRGLLCKRCNVFLGHVRDDPVAMERGADYLRNPPARSVLL